MPIIIYMANENNKVNIHSVFTWKSNTLHTEIIHVVKEINMGIKIRINRNLKKISFWDFLNI